MDKILLRTREAADALGIGRSTLFALLRTGEIRSVQIGRSRRVSRQALEEYVDRIEAEAFDV